MSEKTIASRAGRLPVSPPVLWTGIAAGVFLAVEAMVHGTVLPLALGAIADAALTFLLIVAAAVVLAELTRRHHRVVLQHGGARQRSASGASGGTAEAAMLHDVADAAAQAAETMGAAKAKFTEHYELPREFAARGGLPGQRRYAAGGSRGTSERPDSPHIDARIVGEHQLHRAVDPVTAGRPGIRPARVQRGELGEGPVHASLGQVVIDAPDPGRHHREPLPGSDSRIRDIFRRSLWRHVSLDGQPDSGDRVGERGADGVLGHG